jgi:glutamate N-acetyltransferase / amino-acid N-acetyltransferase
MERVAGGVCAPAGFLAAGVHADIKGKGGTKRDVAIIFSRRPAAAAGVFTRNIVKAAPVLLSERAVRDGSLQALVVNSGNANACTGPRGMADAEEMARATAAALGLEPSTVAVASTGVIGVPLPLDRVGKGIRLCAASLSANGGAEAAAAIMTTDTFPKEIAVRFDLGGVPVTIGGIAKGSGMIHPNMATMLAFITTDAAVTPSVLQAALRQANAGSFNMITVDGDTSTNDMALVLANGLAGNPVIEEGSPLVAPFAAALGEVLVHLAKEIARDGEGATKLMEVQVHGAPSLEDARKAARAVCASALVKTALFGQDANWGRILCAMGYSGASFDPEQVDLYIGDLQMMASGTGLAFDEEAAARVLAEKEVVVRAYLHSGGASATAWGCDFSYDYVKINGSYRT